MKRIIKKILKVVGIVIVAIIVVVLTAHFIGRVINNRTPDGGINESMYVDINGTKQWINIYGEDISNPVLLYLHGGPGSATSTVDYAFTRQWADVYTVVTWDQRNCGKSYKKDYNGTELTYDLFMEDGKEITEFVLDYMDKDKLTILGHSWGSIYGANLVQAYPKYYECFIGTGQLIDIVENEVAFKNTAAEWATGDEEAMDLVEQLTPEAMTMDHITARNKLMEKYGYSMMRDGVDYNFYTTILFNPYYFIVDWIKYFQVDMNDYLDFFISDEFQKFSIQGKFDYDMPYYNINGDDDYQTNYILAGEYFENVKAPYKQLFIMKDTTHGLLESKSKWFSEYVYKIAEMQRWDRDINSDLSPQT